MASGAELFALLKLINFEVDILLIDMFLGTSSMDGSNAIARLKCKYASKMAKTVAVLMSKDCNLRELEACNSFADAFWAKPLPAPDILFVRIAQLITSKLYELRVSKGFARTTSLKKNLSTITLFSEASTTNLDSECDSSSVSAKRLFLRSFSEPILAVYDIRDNLKILVVEDSTIQRKLIMQTLQKSNSSWSVIGIVDSTECIRQLQANKFECDVILFDMNLGDDSLKGYELVKLLRINFKLTRQVFIGISADTRSLARLFVGAGADTVWTKPLPVPIVINQRILTLVQSRHYLHEALIANTVAD